MNFVYENVIEQDYQKVKELLQIILGEPTIDSIQYCIEALTFSNEKGSLNIRYFQTKKLMFQGNFENIQEIIDNIEKDIGLKPKDKPSLQDYSEERESGREIILGFDESGKGETFGSLFLGGIRIEKNNLDYLIGMLKGKDMKKLDKSRIECLFNAIKGKFSYEVKQIFPQDIDSMPLNILLDREYIKLINKISKEPTKEILSLDDYGIGFELQTHINELKRNGMITNVTKEADMKYIASSLASLVSRRARLLDMERLSKENIIINPENGEKIFFQSGSPSNSETEKYLIAYRKLYPFSDFPSFVRTKWGNVREIELRIPKRNSDISFTCKYCQKGGHKICLHYNPLKSVTECFCPACTKHIDVVELKGFFKSKDIIIDTSTIISRIVSKDLNTSKYLEGCNFIIPSLLYGELDSKQPDMKKGGEKEVTELRNFQDNGMIKLVDFDSGDYSDVENDKKFLRILRAKNGVMLTKDRNLATFSEIGEFVIEVIENKESYIKKLK